MKSISFKINPSYVIYPSRIKRVLCNMSETELLRLLELDDTPIKGNVPTTVRVSEECYERLKKISKLYGISMAELARKAYVYKNIPKYPNRLIEIICDGLLRFSDEEILNAPEYNIGNLPGISKEYTECKKRLDELKAKIGWKRPDRASIIKRKVLYLILQDGGYYKFKDLICLGLKRYSVDEIIKAEPYNTGILPDIIKDDGECFNLLNEVKRKTQLNQNLIKQKVLTLVLRDGGWMFTKN